MEDAEGREKDFPGSELRRDSYTAEESASDAPFEKTASMHADRRGIEKSAKDVTEKKGDPAEHFPISFPTLAPFWNPRARIEHLSGWLPRMDSNHDKQIQNLQCYRYTTRQFLLLHLSGLSGYPPWLPWLRCHTGRRTVSQSHQTHDAKQG